MGTVSYVCCGGIGVGGAKWVGEVVMDGHCWAAGIQLVGSGYPCTVHVFPKDPELPAYMYACRLTSSVTRLCVLASMLALRSVQLKGPTINDRWSAGQCHIANTLNQ